MVLSIAKLAFFCEKVVMRTVHRYADIFFRKPVEGFCARWGSIRVRAGRAGERGGRWRAWTSSWPRQQAWRSISSRQTQRRLVLGDTSSTAAADSVVAEQGEFFCPYPGRASQTCREAQNLLFSISLTQFSLP